MCKNIPSLNVELVTRYGGCAWKQQAGGSGMLDPRGEEPTLGMEGWPEEGAWKGTVLGLPRDKQL